MKLRNKQRAMSGVCQKSCSLNKIRGIGRYFSLKRKGGSRSWKADIASARPTVGQVSLTKDVCTVWNRINGIDIVCIGP